MRLKGKVAIITGASRGIGLATAQLFAREGADVVVNVWHAEDAASTLDAVTAEARGSIVVEPGDVSYKETVDTVFDRAMAEFGRVDVLVNNAAVAWSKHFLEYDEAWWDTTIRNNLKSVYLTCRIAAEIMAEQMGGSIVNLSSIGAGQAHRQLVAYDASKGAISAMTRALALDLGPWNIRVNAISPAAVLGAHVGALDEAKMARRDPADFITPLLRQGRPEDVAELALFLASDASAFITGQDIGIDGGLSAQARAYHDSPMSITPQTWRKQEENR